MARLRGQTGLITLGPGKVIAATSAPTSAAVGTRWFNTATAVTYQYTIDAAGTAHESVLSLCASLLSLVLISTLLRGFMRVGIGFIPISITIFCPLLTPPSIPPALFDPLVYLLSCIFGYSIGYIIVLIIKMFS